MNGFRFEQRVLRKLIQQRYKDKKEEVEEEIKSVEIKEGTFSNKIKIEFYKKENKK